MMLEPFNRSPVQNFHLDLTKSVGDAFRNCSLETHFRPYTVADDVTLQFSESNMSKEDEISTKAKVVVDSSGNDEVVEL